MTKLLKRRELFVVLNKLCVFFYPYISSHTFKVGICLFILYIYMYIYKYICDYIWYILDTIIYIYIYFIYIYIYIIYIYVFQSLQKYLKISMRFWCFNMDVCSFQHSWSFGSVFLTSILTATLPWSEMAVGMMLQVLAFRVFLV